ncbi:UDP-glucosyltransferase 29 [Linum perenne]
MFPWLAHGHISPFVELANKLISRRPNLHVYLCSSPINLDSIRETRMIKHPSSRIQLIDLHLPSSPELPPHSHTSKRLPDHLIPNLIQAVDMASSHFSEILTQLSPDLLISDLFQFWAPKLAFDVKIPTVCFMNAAAISPAVTLSSMNNSAEFNGVFPLPSNYMFDYVQVKSTMMPSIVDRFLRSMERSSPILLINSFREIEAEYMDIFSKLIGKSLVTIGPLVPNDDESESDNEIIDWLNKKPQSSVMHISFGSECTLSRSQIQELAHALLILLQKAREPPISFVWVLRLPPGVDLDAALPEGFLEKKNSVYVAADWAPQRSILRHESVGVFLSHCGWNSVMEAIKYGVPIVGAPMRGDQSMNARLVEEIGSGLKVEKIERGELAEVIEKVWMNDCFRDKAKEIRDWLLEKGDRQIDEAIDRFLLSVSDLSRGFY